MTNENALDALCDDILAHGVPSATLGAYGDEIRRECADRAIEYCKQFEGFFEGEDDAYLRSSIMGAEPEEIGLRVSETQTSLHVEGAQTDSTTAFIENDRLTSQAAGIIRMNVEKIREALEETQKIKWLIDECPSHIKLTEAQDKLTKLKSVLSAIDPEAIGRENKLLRKQRIELMGLVSIRPVPSSIAAMIYNMTERHTIELAKLNRAAIMGKE